MFDMIFYFLAWGLIYALMFAAAAAVTAFGFRVLLLAKDICKLIFEKECVNDRD